MNGRLSSVMAELSLLGAVSRPVSLLPLAAPDLDPESPEALLGPPSDHIEPAAFSLDIVPETAPSAEVDAAIAALTEGFREDFSEPAFDDSLVAEDAPEDAPEDAAEDAAEDAPETERPSFEVSPGVRVGYSRKPSAPQPIARRLKEAFARLELLEACAADLRDSLQAVAATIQEDT